jgi:hypothetical protein
MFVALLALALVFPGAALAGDASWYGEYFDTRDLTGAPRMTRYDNAISFDWGGGSPDWRIPVDRFSVRWSRNLWLAGGTWRFSTATDDGVRLFIDGKLVIDRWVDMARTVHWVDIDLAEGDHAVRMEYYENYGGSVAELKWRMIDRNPVGNIITCVRPQNSWIKVYRWDGGSWVDLNARGFGPIGASGYLKLDGMSVNSSLTIDGGHPYRVELWANGSRIRAVGDTAAGQSAFRVYANRDNYTPWGCPAP